MDDVLHLFLDTNTLLHYPPIKDVDWKTVCGCATVRLVLCMQVIHELDEKKDDSRLGDRASRTIKELKAIRAASGAVREGVTIEVFNYEVRAADFPTTLSLDSKDDRIVHSVKMYVKEHSDVRVTVYTEDMGMSLRCEANGVAVIEPDPQRRLENPQTEQEKKHRQMMSELNSLKHRIPLLTLRVVAPDVEPPEKVEPLTVQLAPSWQSLGKQAELAKIRKAHPLLSGLSPELDRYGVTEVWHRYNDQLEMFYVAYEVYIDRLNVWGETNDRTIRFDLWLVNFGNAPAKDVDVFLTLPTSLICVAEAESELAKQLMRPKPPEPPERPTVGLSFSGYKTPTLQPSSAVSTAIARMLAQRHSDFAEVFNLEEGAKIHGKVQNLKHGDHHLVGSFLAIFESWEDVKPFNAEFTISASELPERTTGQIPFLIRPKKTDQ